MTKNSIINLLYYLNCLFFFSFVHSLLDKIHELNGFPNGKVGVWMRLALIEKHNLKGYKNASTRETLNSVLIEWARERERAKE